MSMIELLFAVFLSPFVFFLGFMLLFVLSPLTEPFVIWCEKMRGLIEQKYNRSEES